jgi:hypothetical protein
MNSLIDFLMYVIFPFIFLLVIISQIIMDYKLNKMYKKRFALSVLSAPKEKL